MNEHELGHVQVAAPPTVNAQLFAAIVAMQAKMTNPAKSKMVYAGQKKYAFAPLPEILDHVRPGLAENGLAVTQMIDHGFLVTRLVHKSGESISSSYQLTSTNDPQSMGSAISYARRYALCAALGIAGDDDDDAQAAADATTAEDDERKAAAKAKIDQMKAEGRMKSAHTGKPLAPRESAVPPLVDAPGSAGADHPAEPTPPPAATPPKTTRKTPPKATVTPPPVAATSLTGVNPALATAMTGAGITRAAVEAYITARRHFGDKPVDLTTLPPDYIVNLMMAANFTKVVTAIKNGAQ